jgi:hypothetical protein
VPDLKAENDEVILAIYNEDSPVDPRDNSDSPTTMLIWNKEYTLGDGNEYSSLDAFFAAHEGAKLVMLGLELNDYRYYCTLRETKLDGYEDGVIYATMDTVQKEWGGDIERAKEFMRGEIREYSWYLQGEVYGFKLLDRKTGDEIDSCWGFYGDNMRENGIADALQEKYRYLIDELEPQG